MVSERRSPPFPGGTHTRSVAPGSRLGAEPECGGTDSTLRATGARRRCSPGLGATGEQPCKRPPAKHSLPAPAGRPEAPSPRPPRKRRREMPTSGKPAADCGGDTEWKAKWRRQRRPGAEGRARSSRPRVGPRWPAAAPPACVPALPHPEPRATPGTGSGRRGAGPRARGRCPGAPLSPAGKSGAGAAGGAHSSPEP